MGIGLSFKTLKPGALIKVNPEYRSLIATTKNQSGQFTNMSGSVIRRDHVLLVTKITPHGEGYKRINFKKISSYDGNGKNTLEHTKDIKELWKNTGQLSWGGTPGSMIVSKRMFDNRFIIIEKGFDNFNESLNEKFKEASDPIKDMGIGALKVFAIEVNLSDEEWQISAGVDIVVAYNKEDAKRIWRQQSRPHYYDYKIKISDIHEIDINAPGFYHIQDAAVE